MADPDSRAGARYTSPAITAFLEQLHAPHDAALQHAFGAPERVGLPPISLAPSEGRLLELLARLVSARRCVEVGALAGYSALRIVRGMAPGGHLWSCELDGKALAATKDSLTAAGLADRVTQVPGPARETLPTLTAHGPFDLVFIDADKAGYADYARWATANVRPGGLVVCDNAYLFGRLLEESAEGEAMRECHRIVAGACDSVCVPTPDGLLVGIKR